MYDPQQLSVTGKIRALVALGRLPLASETPLWTVLGCLIASSTFGPDRASYLAMFQCVFVTYSTNCSINYANEYFDWEMDHPGQEAAIRREVMLRGASDGVADDKDKETVRPVVDFLETNDKIMSSSGRIIHDGTFRPWVALAISIASQSLSLILIAYSRHLDPLLNSSSTSPLHTPFKGLTLYIGILSIFFSHQYIGPPLRLHYNGCGEITSTLLLSPVSALFGLTGCYTAIQHTSRLIIPSDLLQSPTATSFGIDTTLWIMLGAMYCTAQARIMIMNINDIDADARGGKITMVVRIGYEWAARAYVALNVVGVVMWIWLVCRLVQGKGAMLGGFQAGSEAAKDSGRIWGIGVGVVLAFSIPVMVLTAASLFANAPHRPAPPRLPSFIPRRELAKVVSLQMLATPIVLCIAIAAAG